MRWLPLLVLTVACGPEEAPREEAPPPPPVRVAVLQTTDVTPTAEGVGTLEAARSVTLRAEVPGRVVDFDAQIGDRVEAGEVIARLDVGRTATALRAANAQVGQAQAQLAAAERQRDLARRLHTSGGAPQARLDEAEDAVRLASAALEAARAQVQVTRRGLTEAVIRAPFAGAIAARFLDEGELAAPGAPIAELVDTSELKARVLLDPRQALDLPVGARATLVAPARPGETFEAEVVRVGEVVDPRSRRLPVELKVHDPERRLRPGLLARFFVETAPPRPALLVPSDAIFERYGQPHVYVVRDGVAERAVVTLGETFGDAVEVREGLAPGDQVVVAGLDRVVHGRPVRVVEEVSSTEGSDAERTETGAAEGDGARPDSEERE